MWKEEERVMSGINRTRYVTLDKVAADPRVVEVWDEGDDGLWIHLAPGFNFEGQAGLHASTVKQLVELFKMVEAGDPS